MDWQLLMQPKFCFFGLGFSDETGKPSRCFSHGIIWFFLQILGIVFNVVVMHLAPVIAFKFRVF